MDGFLKDVVVGVVSALVVIISDRQLIKYRLKVLEFDVREIKKVVFPPFQ